MSSLTTAARPRTRQWPRPAGRPPLTAQRSGDVRSSLVFFFLFGLRPGFVCFVVHDFWCCPLQKKIWRKLTVTLIILANCRQNCYTAIDLYVGPPFCPQRPCDPTREFLYHALEPGAGGARPGRAGA